MTGGMDGVVAQLREVRSRLAANAITAMRAKADAEQALASYTEAAQGTDHPEIRRAIADIRTASDKAARVGRLLDEARERFGNYLNRIAPGSAPDDQPSHAEEIPSGEQLVQEAAGRYDSRRSMDSFLSKMTRNIENLQDAGKSATEVAEKSIKIVRDPFGPKGAQSAGTSPPSPIPPSSAVKINAADAVGHLIVLGLIAGVTLHRSSQLIRREIARFKARGRKKRTE